MQDCILMRDYDHKESMALLYSGNYDAPIKAE